jgi:hypothetical protein
MAAPRFSRPRRPREPGYDIIDPRDGTWIDCFSTLQEARDEVAFLESTEVKPYKQAGVKLVIRKV